jgi:hypothetical protein
MTWLFDDEPNTACFTTKHVLNGSPILRVYHDYDGDWQFHGDSSQSADDEDVKLICLADIVARDATLAELHDLPYGWRAERTSTSQPWTRHKDHPFPTFADNGYYLEDAVWLSEYLPDITPPEADVRENLSVGQYVKLVFRFAAEDSDREDNECERMWVIVTGQDDDGYFLGTIENDPHHDAAKYGDALTFHSLHVAAVDDGE